MVGYSNNELEYLQREARVLFNDKSLLIRQYGPLAGVIINDRLVVHDDDCGVWFVAHAPAAQPHLLSYFGSNVESAKDVEKRQQEEMQSTPVDDPFAHGWHRPEASQSHHRR